MKKYPLGEFEEIVMLTIGILYKNAYGVSIKNEIESRLSRNVSMGAMHSALVRLEGKGYIKSFNGEATEDRMGRPKKYYQITALGKKLWSTRRTRGMNYGMPYVQFGRYAKENKMKRFLDIAYFKREPDAYALGISLNVLPDISHCAGCSHSTYG